ncbi:MAG: DUF4350 domain-containing protein [Acidobacteriaceae bacterium]
MSRATGAGDRKRLLILCAVMTLMILVVSVIAPQGAENDPRPTTDNIGPKGAKAAYLILQELGVKTSRWDRSLTDMNTDWSDAQVGRATLILAAPEYDTTEQKNLAAEVKRFLERGGRVLATGPSGAMLLPDGEVSQAGMIAGGNCNTTPEGPGELARVGSVQMFNSSQWSKEGPAYRVEQRCGKDAVVVSYAVGKGEAVWWSSATPLENATLKNDADLKLLLATVGAGREVVFDESLHGAVKTLWDEAKGLPLRWLALQAALLFVLLIVSFSRRRGPLRSPVQLPRSSPVEFAVSMGDLYEKAAASSSATEAAKRRLLRVLTREAGLAQGTIEEGPDAIAEALRERLGGDWSRVREHLLEAKTAQHEAIAMHSALALVRGLSEDAKRVRECLLPKGRGDEVLKAARI